MIGGIKLQVAAADAARAKDVLADWDRIHAGDGRCGRLRRWRFPEVSGLRGRNLVPADSGAGGKLPRVRQSRGKMPA